MADCADCGAVVSDETIHQEWHSRIELRIHLLEVASGVSPETVQGETVD